MKKFFMFVFLLMFVFLFSACVASPAVEPTNSFAANLVALPDEGRILILELVTAGVAWLLLKLNMGQLKEAIVVVLAPIITTFVESWLGTIPPAFDNIVLTIIHLIVLAVGALGTYILFRRAKTPAVIFSG